MQFNSYIFILLFMPLSVLLYFLFNRISSKAGKILLIAAGIVFYAYADLTALLALLISILMNYAFAVLIKRREQWRRAFMAVPVILNVAILLYFKYTNLFINTLNSAIGTGFSLKDIMLPVGISFITFQQIAYVVAIYSGELEKADIIDYLAFILYFPKILMGPLMDPVDFIHQIDDESLKKVNWDNVACGLKIFAFGLVKKAFLADTLAKAVNWSFSSIGITTAMDWILTGIFYIIELYFDFSGYTDMATGVSLMINIELPVNFDSPFKSLSMKEFWNRWHVSLSKFFTKYIYFPLGGSRKGELSTYVNLMIVFLVTGFWHGANLTFILWGIIHGFIAIFDRIVMKSGKKIFEPFRWFVTIITWAILLLLFRSDSVSQWKEILKILFAMDNTTASSGLISAFETPELTFVSSNIPIIGRLCREIRGFWMNAFLIVSSFICFVPENNYNRLHKNSAFTMILAALALAWGIICLGGESVFLYFNF